METAGRAKLERLGVGAVVVGLLGAVWVGRSSFSVLLYVLFLAALAFTLLSLATRRPRPERVRLGYWASAGLFALFVMANLQELATLLAEYPSFRPAWEALGVFALVAVAFGLLMTGLWMRVFGRSTPKAKRVILAAGAAAYLLILAFLVRAFTGGFNADYFLARVPTDASVTMGVVVAAYVCNGALFFALAFTSLPMRIAVLGPGATGKTQILGLLAGEPTEHEPSKTTQITPYRSGRGVEDRFRVEIYGDDVPGHHHHLWESVLKETRLDALVYVLDHRDHPRELRTAIDRTRFFVDKALEVRPRQPNLASILVLYNKRDEWGPKRTLEDVQGPYREEMARLRRGYVVVERASCSKGTPEEVDVLDIIRDHLG